MGVKYECKKCDKIFASKGDYTRHMQRKIPCDKKDKDAKVYDNKPNDNDISKQILNKMNELIEANKQTKIQIEQSNIRFEQMSEEIKSLKNKINNNEDKKVDVNEIKNNVVINKNDNSDNSSNNGNNSNNSNSNNNSNNVNLQQIIVVPHGKEDLSFLTEKQIKKILNEGLLSISEYVKAVHCNDEKPEYKNIYISNRKNMNGSLMILGEKRWDLSNKSCIDTLVDKGIDFVEEQYDELTEKKVLPVAIIKKVDRFKSHLETDTNAKKAKICEDVKLILYNNRPL